MVNTLSIKSLLTLHSSSLIRLAALGFAQAACYIGTAIVVQRVFDRFLVGGEHLTSKDIYFYVGVLTFVAIISGLVFMKERIYAERVGQNIVHDLRISIFKHLTKVYPRDLEKKKKGGLNLRLVNDLTAVRQWITFGLSKIIVSGISVVLTIAALAYTSVLLAVIILFFVVLGVLFSVYLGPKLERRVYKARNCRANLANNAGEKISAMRTVQIFGQEKSELRRIKRQSKSLVDAMVDRSEMIGLLRGSVIVLTGLSTMSILVVGAYLVGMGNTTPGTVIASMTIIGFLIPPIRDFGRTYEYWISFNVARKYILETLSLKRTYLKSKRNVGVKHIKGEIEFKNITLNGVFSNFSAKVNSKDKIVITGLNGAGKSTLFALLLGIVKPDKGKILVDGKPLKDWNLSFLRSRIGVVSSDLPLLRGTLRNNISYRHKSIGDSDIDDVIELLGLSKKLKKMPHGLDTKIAERGSNLSSGEKQIISIARALLGEPEILLLDEADSSLDKGSKEIIKKLVKEYDGTILSITHNKSLIKTADYIWKIKPQQKNKK